MKLSIYSTFIFALLTSANVYSQELKCPQGSTLYQYASLDEKSQKNAFYEITKYSFILGYGPTAQNISETKEFSFCAKKTEDSFLLNGPFSIVPLPKNNKRDSGHFGFSGTFVDGKLSGTAVVKNDSNQRIGEFIFDENGNYKKAIAYSPVDGKPYMTQTFQSTEREEVRFSKKTFRNETAHHRETFDTYTSLIQLANGRLYCLKSKDEQTVEAQVRLVHAKSKPEIAVSPALGHMSKMGKEEVLSRILFDNSVTSMKVKVSTANATAEEVYSELVENYDGPVIRYNSKTGQVTIKYFCTGNNGERTYRTIDLLFTQKYPKVEEISCAHIIDYIAKARETELEPICKLTDLETELKKLQSSSSPSLAEQAKINELSQSIKETKFEAESSKRRMKDVGIIVK